MASGGAGPLLTLPCLGFRPGCILNRSIWGERPYTGTVVRAVVRGAESTGG
jgi:hypothetical protein